MQFTITAITALLASASLAIAGPVNERRQFEAQITFIGAAGAEYSISAPTDATSFVIGMASLIITYHHYILQFKINTRPSANTNHRSSS
jgi:hypothetical protein